MITTQPVLSFVLIHEDNRSVVLNDDREVVFVSISEDDAYDFWWDALSESERKAHQNWMDDLRIDAEIASAARHERATLCCDR